VEQTLRRASGRCFGGRRRERRPNENRSRQVRVAASERSRRVERNRAALLLRRAFIERGIKGRRIARSERDFRSRVEIESGPDALERAGLAEGRGDPKYDWIDLVVVCLGLSGDRRQPLAQR